MKELLELIVKSLVDDPDSVVITMTESEKGINLAVSVASEDVGRIIGKEGRIAKSIRTVIRAASRNVDKPVFVDIV
ncbi:MAG: KH domain-containing protein [Ruminococcaceae bacterium]|nr:KH domain-containing protein [Oscillospiraceae bacterium]